MLLHLQTEDRPSLPSGFGKPGPVARTFTRWGDSPIRSAMSAAITRSVCESIRTASRYTRRCSTLLRRPSPATPIGPERSGSLLIRLSGSLRIHLVARRPPVDQLWCGGFPLCSSIASESVTLVHVSAVSIRGSARPRSSASSTSKATPRPTASAYPSEARC
jgi:hypothetical protein